MSRQRKHFIVKHGLDAFHELPNYIWRTAAGPEKPPHRFTQVKSGDRWISFAYTTSDSHERSLSLVTGFYECVEEAAYGKTATGQECWHIRGNSFGWQPHYPVGVPPLADLLGHPVWANQAITPITEHDFDRVQQFAADNEFDPAKIPLLGREPANEQELLAIVAHAYEDLGIAKIVRIRSAFPDLRVRLKGSSQDIHLELELYSDSFLAHGHAEHVCEKKFIDKHFQQDCCPVAVLCWIDNLRWKHDSAVADCVDAVYELRSLIRQGLPILYPGV